MERASSSGRPQSSSCYTDRGYPPDTAKPAVERGASSQVHPIGRALDRRRPAVQDMRVDHGGADVAVAEKLLDGPDIPVILEQVSREGVTQRVSGRAHRDPCTPHGVLDGPLHDRLVQMMPSPLACHSVDVVARGRKHPLPGPLAARVRILSR